jgi:hypothetical protein
MHLLEKYNVLVREVSKTRLTEGRIGEMKSFTKCACVVAVAALFVAAHAKAVTTLVDWNFETSIPSTAGPINPEVGSGSASGSHVAVGTVYSSPAGDMSSHSYSANGWAVNDYWQFQLSTLGDTGIALNYDQNGSGTGPRDFVLQYSTDGSTFTQFGSQYSLAAASTWSATSTSLLPTIESFDLSSITALDNQSAVYFRIVDNSTTAINGSAVGTGGTDRVDNFTVTAATVVPEPSTMLLAGAGLASLLALRRRRS